MNTTPSAREKRVVVLIFSIAITAPSAAIQIDVHHPDREHQQHHRPAAAEAIEPLAQAEAEHAARLGGPVGEEERERMLALRDAGVLQRGELIERRRR